MSSEGKSGKLVVAVMVTLIALAVFIAWFGFNKLLPPGDPVGQGTTGAPRVLADGVVYVAEAGEPGFVSAKDIRSGKEVWRTELGSVTSPPAIIVAEEVVEVQIAGTPWMTLNRESGEPVE